MMARREAEGSDEDVDTEGSVEQNENGISYDGSSLDGSSPASFSSGLDTATFVTCVPENSNVDLKLPETVTILDGEHGGKVYLIGTAHFSEQSQQDVRETIRMTQPNVVVLELCESRVSILSFDEKTILEESKSLNMNKIRNHIKEYGVVQGVMYLVLLTLSSHLTKELGMAPGGEFRVGFQEAKKIPGCVVHLGDRPIHITLRRAISSLTVWQKLKLAYSILFSKESISKEEVEKYKQKDMLEEMLAEMTGEFPALSKVFVEERDTYLAYSLRLAASPVPDYESPRGYKPAIVIGVVGIGHLSGIVKQWDKVTDSDIPPLLTIPQRSMVTVLMLKDVRKRFTPHLVQFLQRNITTIFNEEHICRLVSQLLLLRWDEDILSNLAQEVGAYLGSQNLFAEDNQTTFDEHGVFCLIKENLRYDNAVYRATPKSDRETKPFFTVAFAEALTSKQVELMSNTWRALN